MTKLRSRLVLALVVVSLVASAAAAPVLAAESTNTVDTDADAAHNPYVDADVEKATHEMGWSDQEYEDDQGDMATLPAETNTTADNPYKLTYSDIETSAYGEFPVNSKTEDVDSALNASGWATPTGSPTVSDVTTAPGVEAVEVTNSSMADGDTAEATFNGFKITSDIDKRYVQVVADVDTLNSASNVSIRFEDTDGDYVAAEIDPDDDSSTGNTMANATGDGYVFQQQIGEMTVTNPGAGDGTLDNINQTTVHIEDGDATIQIAALNVEKTKPWKLGEEKVDSDGDDELETETVHEINSSGNYAIRSLDSMGTSFDAATIHDLTIPMKFYSGMQSGETEDDKAKHNLTAENATQFVNFEWRVTDYRRIVIPSAYDLSYSNTELRMNQPVPDTRYQEVGYATDQADTNVSDISFTDVTSSFSSVDDEVDMTTGVNAGEVTVVKIDYVVTADELTDILSIDTGGGGAPMDDDSGGFFGNIWAQLMTLVGGVLGFLGLKRAGGN